MPRAHRYLLPGHVWHITHRCHKQEFLLKFARDRDRWRYWLYQAKKRYGLSVLNYIVTCNHIHLLVHDQGAGEITKSMQLIAGRTAQEYNLRKRRKGACWEDRYHATAVEVGYHLTRCLTYIDLNMVRAGVVTLPEDWIWSGYYEIQYPSPRYRVIDEAVLLKLCDVESVENFRAMRREWVISESVAHRLKRDTDWSDSLAVGSAGYIEAVKNALGDRGRTRRVVEDGNAWVLRDSLIPYTVHSGG